MEAITDGKVSFLNGNLDYMERFGIPIGADKKVPKKDGIPFFKPSGSDPDGFCVQKKNGEGN